MLVKELKTTLYSPKVLDASHLNLKSCAPMFCTQFQGFTGYKQIQSLAAISEINQSEVLLINDRICSV